MKPSKYQQDVFAAVVATDKHVAVKAGPGSGKTTTIVEAAKLIPYNKSAVFVAFNKRIVEELKERLPQTVMCATMHSIGMKAIINYFQGAKVKVNENKQIKFIEPYTADIRSPKIKWSAIYGADRIVSLMRATMAPVTKEGADKVVADYAIDAEDLWIDLAVKGLKDLYAYNDRESFYDIEIDFQDMIEMCIRETKMRMPRYDFVFIDEIQDLSALDHLFVGKLRKPEGRVIGVGDPKQSIYGFRGSNPNAFEAFSQQPNTTVLPLSISYRCCKSVVRRAQEVYQDIEPYEHNQEGIVRVGQVQEIKEGDMVLCRNTRPLVDVFLRLIDRGLKAYIVGKDMQKGLNDLIDRYCEPDMDTKEAPKALDKAYTDVLAQLKARGISRPENHPKASLLMEKLDILKLLMARFDVVSQVVAFIDEVFNDQSRVGVELMTIHKSKGLERDTVFVIEKYQGQTLIPSPHAITPDQLKQETNLRFVAYTRAKMELVLVNL